MSNRKQPEGFFYQEKTIRWIMRIFYVLCVLLFLVDFLVHRHIMTSAEKIPAFYAFYGLVACIVLVLIASQMRRLLMRDENYYTKDEASIDKIDTDKSASHDTQSQHLKYSKVGHND